MPTQTYKPRHTYPCRPTGGTSREIRALLLVVYLRLRTLSITLTSKVLDVAGGGCGGSVLPVVGMSPAKIEIDNTHTSASAIANRFIGVAPLRLRKMPMRLHKN